MEPLWSIKYASIFMQHYAYDGLAILAKQLLQCNRKSQYLHDINSLHKYLQHGALEMNCSWKNNWRSSGKISIKMQILLNSLGKKIAEI